MKHLKPYNRILALFFASTLLGSCTSVAKFSSAKTIDITPSIVQKPTVADLVVKEVKVSGEFTGKNMSNTHHQEEQVPGTDFDQFYDHPDGHAVMFDEAGRELLLFNADSFTSLAVPMSTVMLVEVGERMVALGKKLLTKF